MCINQQVTSGDENPTWRRLPQGIRMLRYPSSTHIWQVRTIPGDFNSPAFPAKHVSAKMKASGTD